MRQSDEIRRLHAEATKPMHISRQLGIARSSVYRVLGPEADHEGHLKRTDL